jgi:hypothetical protein
VPRLKIEHEHENEQEMREEPRQGKKGATP